MRNIFRPLFVALIVSLFIMGTTSSYADWHGHGGGGGYHNGGGHWGRGHGYIGVNLAVWPDSYYYGAPYYYPDDVLVSSPVTVVEQPVTVVQPPPVITQEEPPVQAVATPVVAEDSFTINIPNDKGGYTAVILKKSGNGFIGPQGEFYPEFPKVSHLKVIYGK